MTVVENPVAFNLYGQDRDFLIALFAIGAALRASRVLVARSVPVPNRYSGLAGLVDTPHSANLSFVALVGPVP